MARDVILIAYHFPPEEIIGAARPFRFYKYLSRMGVKCHVITAADQGREDQADTIVIPDSFESQRYGVGWQVERAIRRLLIPGEVGLQWAYRAAKAVRKLVRQNPATSFSIYSSFPPLGVHLAAWLVARRGG